MGTRRQNTKVTSAATYGKKTNSWTILQFQITSTNKSWQCGLRDILLVICSECAPSEETEIVVPQTVLIPTAIIYLKSNAIPTVSMFGSVLECFQLSTLRAIAWEVDNLEHTKGQVFCPIFFIKENVNTELEDNYSRFLLSWTGQWSWMFAELSIWLPHVRCSTVSLRTTTQI